MRAYRLSEGTWSTVHNRQLTQLCTTKFAQTTSQHYFVLQSLHKARSSTTLYYTACTKHFPVLLCTRQLAQTTSQYYCVLQSLHKALPSTTLYYKACTKHVPVLLCTTQLAQSTSQYYFVLQTGMTSCLETFEKERFCSFPHRHGDATGKPETRDETRGCSNTSISCETPSNFDTFGTLSTRLECHKVPRLPRTTPRRPDDDATMTRRRPDEPLEANKGRVQPPDPQTINGNPSLRIREKVVQSISKQRHPMPIPQMIPFFQSAFQVDQSPGHNGLAAPDFSLCPLRWLQTTHCVPSWAKRALSCGALRVMADNGRSQLQLGRVQLHGKELGETVDVDPLGIFKRILVI